MSPPKPVDPTAFKRAEGAYRSGDGRFTIEPASGRWMVIDAEQQDDLGLPLARGPYGTLAAARAAALAARSTPAPSSDLQARRSAGARSAPAASAPVGRPGARRGTRPALRTAQPQARAPKPPPLELRRYAHGDGAALRTFWAGIGLRSVGDDDNSLDLLAERNPGLVLVATEGGRIVGSALGAWDGRRGWIYHVGTAADRRRAGLGRRLVHEVERRLRALGCPKVNVIVKDDSPGAAAFWEALGYTSPPARQYGKEL